MLRMNRFPTLDKILCLSLSVLMLAGHLPVWADPSMLTGDVRVTVSPANIRETIAIPGGGRKVTMAFHGVAVQDALRALARKGGFNLLIDESVTGSVSVELNNVTIQDALESLKTLANLAYSVQGSNLMVADANSPKGQAYQKTVTRIIALKNANARVVADLLNRTVFADRTSGTSSGGGNQPMPVTPDFHTNSLVVVGSPTDVKTVMEHVVALDKPRQMKTWRLSQANALDVATLLSSSLFNEGSPAVVVGGTSSSSGGAGQDGTPSSMRVTADNIAEGQGSSQASQSSSGGSSGQSSLVSNMTLRGRVKQSQSIQISPNGPIIIPDTRMNTVTLLATAEQIAMAEALIPTLDRKIPQVVLEASLVEISEEGRKELGYSTGSNGPYFSHGHNQSPSATRLVNQVFSNTIGRTTSALTPLEDIWRFTTNSSNRQAGFLYQLTALVSQNKAKMLANPTVITTSDNETIISIVDEIIKSVTITQGLGVPPTATDNIGEAGIVLNILPKVGADGTVSMRVRPVISTVAATRRDRFGNLVTLLAKREVLAQNTVLRDGETFVLGGLVHNTNSDEVARSPMLSKLPILGALARNSTAGRTKTELVVLITPHIINDESQVIRSSHVPNSQLIPATLANLAKKQQSGGSGEPGMVPVSMSDSKAKPSVLPPLEQVRVIGNSSSATWDPSPAQPARKPIGEAVAPSSRVFQSSSIVPASVQGSSAVPSGYSSVSQAKPARKPVSDSPSPAASISDETIRGIMDKFK